MLIRVSSFGATLPDGNVVTISNAIVAATAGDTLQVPAGTWSWSNEIATTKSIRIIGAGIGQTIWLDNSPPAAQYMISLAGTNSEFAHATIVNGDRVGVFNAGCVLAYGENTRLHHLYFSNVLNNCIYFGTTTGLVDHCTFYMEAVFSHCILVLPSSWSSYGDKSWSEPLVWGTPNVGVFIEDCTFTGHVPHSALIDSWRGGRFVFRHNIVTNDFVSNHGTETSGRLRGGRAMEIYNNLFRDTGAWDRAIDIRSGSALVFSNDTSGYGNFVGMNNNRSVAAFNPWMGADGTNAWDLNTNGVYASGTHVGTNGAFVLVDTNVSWTVGQWYGYTLRNLASNTFSLITANTSTNLSYLLSSPGNVPIMQFNAGNSYEIRRVLVVMDGVGWGGGAEISGDTPSIPVGWWNQTNEMVYAWDNVGQTNLATAFPSVVGGRDYTNGVAKPGYTPYTYPHPLIAYFDGPAQSAPTTISATRANVGLIRRP